MARVLFVNPDVSVYFSVKMHYISGHSKKGVELC